MWECPDLFSLGNWYVLLFGAQPEFRYTYYFLGRYADHRFTPEILGKVDYGRYFYAAQTLLDDKGRRIMWGWLKEGRSDEAVQAAGWAGVMSLPRIMTLRPDGRLGVEPAPELRALRGQHHRLTDIELTPTSSRTLEDLQGDCLEMAVEFEVGDAAEFGLQVRCSPDGAEGTRIVYGCAAGRLAVDREQSSLSPGVDRDWQEGLLDLSPDGELRLHVYLDCSVVEVYADGHFCLTSRVYPSRTDSLGVGLFAHGGTVKVRSLDAWQITSKG
jgi:beta-fructofuranosidase